MSISTILHHLTAFLFLKPDVKFFLQVRLLARPGSLFRQLRDRRRPGGLRDGAAASAGSAALLRPHGARPLGCREKIRQTGL